MNTFERKSIELEVKVRHLEEQLAQAHQTIQYVLQLQVQQASRHHGWYNGGDEFRIRELEAQVACLRVLEDGRGYNTPRLALDLPSRRGRLGPTAFEYGYPSPGSEKAKIYPQQQDEGDLLGVEDLRPSVSTSSTTTLLDGDASLEPKTTSTTNAGIPCTSFGTGSSPHDLVDLSGGLGISHLSKGGQATTTPQVPAAEHALDPAKTKLTITEDGGWTAVVAPAPPKRELRFKKPFLAFEHKKLDGLATFIEDWPEDEQMSNWDRLAARDGRHSASEWKAYYEATVQPTFLRKMKARQAAEEAVAATRMEEEAKEYDAGDEANGTRDQSPTTPETPDQPTNGVEGDQQTAQQDAEPKALAEAGGILASRWAPKEQIDHAELFEKSPYSLPKSPKVTTADAMAPIDASMFRFDGDDEDSPPKTKAARSDQVQIATTGQDAQTGLEKTMEDESQLPSPKTPTGASAVQPSTSLPPHVRKRVAPPTPPVDSSDSELGGGCDNELVGGCGRPPRGPRGPRGGSRRDGWDVLFRYNSKDEGICHSVLISGLPCTTTLADVVAKVSGGIIVSTVFATMAGMKLKSGQSTTTNAAVVKFFGNGRAAAFVKHCQQHPITFTTDFTSSLTQAAVTLIPTPTRPLPNTLAFNFHNHNLTRVLFIVDPEHNWTPEDVVQEFQRFILYDENKGVRRPLVMGRAYDDMLFFEFADVKDAQSAWHVVDRDTGFFGGASKGPWPDPCDRPLGGTLKCRGEEEGGEVGEVGDGEESEGSKIKVSGSDAGVDDVSVKGEEEEEE
ncbi:uncharacterized protein LTR77_002106 [Saxophila tyrrhenica]|uniref:Myb-like domain-containing protein n=1 Tax=Saxophila tyrrhenica TaxID=1690608 RepID=A0AAV9PKQ6_9PEZI|nr:hypothetical protein LTR77_002106 [Saxophila tyrrhenica]